MLAILQVSILGCDSACKHFVAFLAYFSHHVFISMQTRQLLVCVCVCVCVCMRVCINAVCVSYFMSVLPSAKMFYSVHTAKNVDMHTRKMSIERQQTHY